LKGVIPDGNVGTMHSIAYRSLGEYYPLAQDGDLLKQFAATHPQWRVSQNQDWDGGLGAIGVDGGTHLEAYSLYRSVMAPRELWVPEVLGFAEDWERFKSDTGAIDFCDMLELALTQQRAHPRIPQVIVCDELQDLSRLQYKLLMHWGRYTRRVVAAGDQDQTIYGFAGADPKIWDEHADDEIILTKSWRVPSAIHSAAMRWVSQITSRRKVEYSPRDAVGTVEYSPVTHEDITPLMDDIVTEMRNGRTVMIMASCQYMLTHTLETLRDYGIPYANPWRRDPVWNPLGCESETSELVKAVNAFLKPQHDAHNECRGLWSHDQLSLWSSVLARVFRRGAKAWLSQNAGASPFDLFLWLADAMSHNDFRAATSLDARLALNWFCENVATRYTAKAEYLKRIVDRFGVEALQTKPTVFCGTIHSFKGAEADVVVLFPDLSMAAWNELLTPRRDAIVRLFYVGMTRAKERLVLCAPQHWCAVVWP